MPDEKKNHKKNDSKEQRKPRRGRHHEATKQMQQKADKTNETKEASKVTVPEKPVLESPGPEFYKSLKRETEEIIKITEEETSKYKKKEIQSNWAKYEMPIESYKEIEEQEHLGADYEKLIQAPLSVGGHFQFKHEKSWDVSSGPSPYDKYFEINMENLCLAISTVPFYERNAIDLAAFNESDMLSMNNRATRFKQKYFNDKSYSTPEIEAQEKILKHLKDDKIDPAEKQVQENILQNLKENLDNVDDENNDKPSDTEKENTNLDYKENCYISGKADATDNIELGIDNIDKSQEKVKENSSNNENNLVIDNNLDIQFEQNHDFIFKKAETKPLLKATNIESNKNTDAKSISEVNAKPHSETKKLVIESPEDLEKWLDDFLDS